MPQSSVTEISLEETNFICIEGIALTDPELYSESSHSEKSNITATFLLFQNSNNSTNFFRIEAERKVAIFVNDVIRKGDRLRVEGNLYSRKILTPGDSSLCLNLDNIENLILLKHFYTDSFEQINRSKSDYLETVGNRRGSRYEKYSTN